FTNSGFYPPSLSATLHPLASVRPPTPSFSPPPPIPFPFHPPQKKSGSRRITCSSPIVAHAPCPPLFPSLPLAAAPCWAAPSDRELLLLLQDLAGMMERRLYRLSAFPEA
ncbi:hypothetical protein U9M48_030829, partial [Paspalum notatum var. saurae]